jgi:hypothetical protein
MPDPGQQGTLGDTITAQAIGDEAFRLILQSVQQPLEEALGCMAISPFLYQDVQHHPNATARQP